MKKYDEVIMDIGIDKTNREMIADGLTRVLADNYILFLKTRNYHWNVTGPNFSQLHALFQSVYESLDEAGDEIAERIRALGYKAPGSYIEFITVSVLREEIGEPDSTEMLQQLVLDVEHLVRRTDEVKEVSLMGKDDVTADLLIGQLRSLEKFAWMLRSHLER